MANAATRVMTDASEEREEATAAAGVPVPSLGEAAAGTPVLRPVEAGAIRSAPAKGSEPTFVPVEVDDNGQPLGASTAPAAPADEVGADFAGEQPSAEDLEPGQGGEQPGADGGTQQHPRRSRNQARREHRQRLERDNEGLRRQVLALGTQIQALTGQIGAIEPRLGQIGDEQRRGQAAALDNDLRAATTRLAQANQTLVEAINGGDSAAAVKALEMRDELAEQKRSLELAKRQFTAPARQPTMAPQPQPQPTGQVAPPISPTVQSYIDDFHDRYADWFDPRGNDIDSRIVYRLDEEVANSGLRPDTPAYWDRMDELMRQYLPHHFADEGAPPNGQARRPATAQRPAVAPVRRGPPVAGPSTSSPVIPKNAVKITRERKNALIEANILNPDGTVADEGRFQRVLRRYDEFDKRESAGR